MLACGLCRIGPAAPIQGPLDRTRPNVVLILADDMGVDSVSAYNDQLGMKTPAIDRLASQGMRFTDAHSNSSVCSPTRYSLLTGRYSWRSRLKRGIVGTWERPLFEPDRLTLAEMMRGQGYATACIGKWHLGWNWPDAAGQPTTKLAEIDFSRPIGGGPCDHGFDEYFGDDVPNWPPYAWRENDRILGQLTAEIEAGAMVGVSKGPATEDWDFHAVLKATSDRCADYIRRQAGQQRPFFLYYPMPSPHTPIAPHPDFQGRSGAGPYADFLIQTDAAVGQVLEALAESGQADNTIVLFTADNGTSPKADFDKLAANGIHLNHHWRGWKADAYEGGHRVPFIVRWPGEVEAGATCQQPITLADVMATCAEVTEFDLPDDAAEDSLSLVGLCRQDPEAQTHSFVIHHSITGKFAIRQGPWKLLLCAGSGGWSPPRDPQAEKQELPARQLFHLGDDPREATNLESLHPERVAQLTALLRQAVQSGRTRPGPPQPNHAGKSWWPGLPWPEPTLPPSPPPQDTDAVPGYQARRVQGWTVQVSDQLINEQPEATKEALRLLDQQLVLTRRALPPSALETLQQVSIWFSPPYPGQRPTGEYHPSAGWLKRAGRRPELHRNIEFTNTRRFAQEVRRMPVLVIHELAHAYHHRVLGYDHPQVREAYEAAKAAGIYEAVTRNHGRTERAYALENPMEYFAETSEALFGTNDFYPYDRKELWDHDPRMAQLLMKLWQVPQEDKK